MLTIILTTLSLILIFVFFSYLFLKNISKHVKLTLKNADLSESEKDKLRKKIGGYKGKIVIIQNGKN